MPPTKEWITERLADYKACRSHREVAAITSMFAQWEAGLLEEFDTESGWWAGRIRAALQRRATLTQKVLTEARALLKDIDAEPATIDDRCPMCQEDMRLVNEREHPIYRCSACDWEEEA